MSAAPGWYDDPSKLGWLRYWDGLGWTEQTQLRPLVKPDANMEQGSAVPASIGPADSAPSVQSALSGAAAQSTVPSAKDSVPKHVMRPGSIVVILVGAILLIAVIGLSLLVRLRAYSAESVNTPAEYTVATGVVEVSHTEVWIADVVPPEWDDLTGAHRL